MVYSPPGSSAQGILQVRILEGVAISFFRGSSQPRDRTCVSCIVGGFFTTEPPGKPSTGVGREKWVIMGLYETMCVKPFRLKKHYKTERLFIKKNVYIQEIYNLKNPLVIFCVCGFACVDTVVFELGAFKAISASHRTISGSVKRLRWKPCQDLTGPLSLRQNLDWWMLGPLLIPCSASHFV